MNNFNVFPFADGWDTGSVEVFGESAQDIDLSKMITIGSCVSRNVIRWLESCEIVDRKMLHGTLYNPFSINYEMQRLYSDIEWQKGILTYRDNDTDQSVVIDPWRTWISASSLDELICKNAQFDNDARAVFENSSAFFFTYGLSEVWNLKSDDKMILNQVPIECMKQGQDSWTHRFASVDEITLAISQTIETVIENIGNVPIFIASTPGPLKYTASNASVRWANNISKAILAQSFYEVSNKYDNVIYFPTTEILQSLDENNISIWQPDRRHVNATVIDYLGRQFVNYCGDQKSKQKLKDITDFWVPQLSKEGKLDGKSLIDKDIQHSIIEAFNKTI